MLYVGIDRHRKQLTVSVREETGNGLLRRQVSTEWPRVRAFLNELAERSAPEGGYLAIVEICGFNHWPLKLLAERGCREMIVVQPEGQSAHKTDRRDAGALSEVLWVNRDRVRQGLPVRGLRRIQVPGAAEQADRRLTSLRHDVGRELTRSINRMKAVLRRHNLEQECPTKGIQTQRARKWLERLPLEAVERAELAYQLARQDLLRQQLKHLQTEILRRYEAHPAARLISTLPGAAAYTSLGLASRIGDVRRFRHPRSLANYWGLTPGSRNSGEATQRLRQVANVGFPCRVTVNSKPRPRGTESGTRAPHLLDRATLKTRSALAHVVDLSEVLPCHRFCHRTLETASQTAENMRIVHAPNPLSAATKSAQKTPTFNSFDALFPVQLWIIQSTFESWVGN